MPKVTQVGIQIVFGDGECPPLPPGYTLHRKSECCAKARDAQGNEYLIALNPPRLVRIIKREPRNTTCDFDHPIPL